jgi:MFS family permease
MSATTRVFADVARNRELRLVTTAFSCFIVTEYAVWIAMLVYAFDQGGVVTSGLVALAQLVPAAIAGPLVAPWADRHSPVTVLIGGYVTQALGMAATAAFILVDQPFAAYAGAVVASTAVATTRPAQAALVPALTREVQQLTAANVVFGWVDSLSVLVAGGAVGLALTFGGVATVFACGAVLLGAAVMLVRPLRVRSSRSEPDPDDEDGEPEGWTHGFGEVLRNPAARLLVGLLGAEFAVVGALDVMFVVLAIDVLDAGQPWVGYLNMAFGAGGVLLGALAVLLVGRRLGPVILAAALVLSLALALTSVAPTPVVAGLLLAVVGGGHTLFDVASRALLQRAVRGDLVARIFGVAEGLTMAGLAVGSVLAPVLVALVGGRLAMVGVAMLLPVLVIVRVRALRSVDEHARVPVVEIALLRSLPLFRDMPGPALEGLAQALERTDFEPGTVIIRAGDEGDHYFVLVEGTVEIRRAGQQVRTLGRGDGMGEIALLRSTPRTATAVATSAVTAYTLDRQSFLTAVNGHAPTRRSATRIADDVQAADERRDLS